MSNETSWVSLPFDHVGTMFHNFRSLPDRITDSAFSFHAYICRYVMCVHFVKFVTTFAVSLLSVAERCPSNIFGMRYRFQMFGFATNIVLAKMVHFMLVRDWPHPQIVGEAMSWRKLFSYPDLSVFAVGQRPGPLQAENSTMLFCIATEASPEQSLFHLFRRGLHMGTLYPNFGGGEIVAYLPRI